MKRAAVALAGALTLISGAATAQTCLQIDRINATGVTLLSQAELRAALKPYEGQCLGIDGLNKALEAITFAYVEKGYITARAYLPEQNVADRQLDIAVVEGQLEAIRFNGEERRLWQHIVFPKMVGKPLQLRDVEQGLDAIRTMPAYSAEMEISAGSGEGDSVLNVEATAKHPWTFRIGANNYASRQNGGTATTEPEILPTYTGSLDATLSHVFGLNETFTFGYSRGTETWPFDQNDGTYSTTRYELGFQIPFGKWDLGLKYVNSDYALAGIGAITLGKSDGWVHEAQIRLGRVLKRTKDTKTTLTGTLEWRDNVDRIVEIVVDASSRTLSSLRIELAHERVFKKGLMTGTVAVERGLTWFGAERSAPGAPEAQFTLVNFSLDYSRPFKLEKGSLSYSTSLRGQWSDDPLHGNYQFGLGGTSTVRGTSRSLMSGANGILWRNELSWSPALPEKWKVKGGLQLYGALDVGHIFEKYATSIDGTLAGGAIGIRGQLGKVNFDAAWHEILSVPTGIDKPEGELLVSVSVRF